ncbi:MAG: hypothetical protein GY816_20460 [Cytophagales bacterium]|nr:hypothetical protein [Cytophagales bacterium]
MDSNWKNKFDDAEMIPPAKIWDNVEANLETGGNKGKTIAFTILGWAAALTLFAASSVVVWHFSKSNSRDQTEITTINQPTTDIEILNQSEAAVIDDLSGTDDQTEKPEDELDMTRSTNSIEKTVPELSAFVRNEDHLTSDPDSNNMFKENILPEENSGELMALPENNSEILEDDNIAESMVDNSKELATGDIDNDEGVLDESPLLPWIDEERDLNTSIKSIKKKRLWVGLSQGIGGYSSNFSSGSNDALASMDVADGFSLENTLASEQTIGRSIEEKQVINTALLIGVPIGAKLDLVTGVNYSKSSFSSSAVNVNDELLHFTAEEIDIETAGSVSYQQVDLNGYYEMATIPLLADYHIFSGKFSWSVQAGPEVGLLVQQRIINKDLGLERTTKAGELYRPMHLRVALGSTLTYSLGNNYLASFNPVLEQTITSITTTQSTFSSRPLNYSFLFGLRYQFK